jgi:hypothetical protein
MQINRARFALKIIHICTIIIEIWANRVEKINFDFLHSAVIIRSIRFHWFY